MSEQTFVIAGGGVAGATAALTLRERGFGGRIVVVDAESHPPYNRPPLTKAVVRGELDGARTHMRPARVWESRRIELLLGHRITTFDTAGHVVELDDGSRITYDRLLLATGGTARQLPGVFGTGVQVVRTLDDALALRPLLGGGRRLAIIGAGFLGAELAASAITVGSSVTVFEAEDLPLARLLPPALGELYAGLHRSHGVDLRLATKVSAITPAADGLQIHDADGGVTSAEAVVAAIGMEPDVTLARAAGLEVDNGILVDEYCQTSAPDVFAAGDVANHINPILGRRIRVEHWQNAQHQAAAAARNMLGAHEPFAEVPWVWSEQYDVKLEIAGVPAPDDDVVIEGDPVTLEFVAYLLREGVLKAVIGLNRSDAVRSARQAIAEGRTPTFDLAGGVTARRS